MTAGLSDIIEFTVSRDLLLSALQLVSGAVERKQSMEILSHVYFAVSATEISLLATDLEMELQAFVAPDNVAHTGIFTLPAKKIIDICRSLPADAQLHVLASGEKVVLKSGRSRFNLLARAASDFPRIKLSQNTLEFSMPENALLQLLEATSFAMAQQDVRIFFNGTLLEFQGDRIHAVATNGHRLAKMVCQPLARQFELRQIILPRKSVIELLRLLQKHEKPINISLSENHLTIHSSYGRFTSCLLEGRYPDYRRAIPQKTPCVFSLENESLKQALSRVSILSNEKLKGVFLDIKPNLLRIVANNVEQEEAEELLEIDYQGARVELSLNVTYLLDVLTVLPPGPVSLYFSEAANASLLIESALLRSALYVIMPMRL